MIKCYHKLVFYRSNLVKLQLEIFKCWTRWWQVLIKFPKKPNFKTLWYRIIKWEYFNKILIQGSSLKFDTCFKTLKLICFINLTPLKHQPCKNEPLMELDNASKSQSESLPDCKRTESWRKMESFRAVCFILEVIYSLSKKH